MGTAFANWWTAQQRAAFFGSASLVVPVTYFLPTENPATDTGHTINCNICQRGEQAMSGDYDRSERKAVTAINRAEVPTLTRASTGFYGYLRDAAGVVFAIVRIERENAALYVVELQRQEFDVIGHARGGRT